MFAIVNLPKSPLLIAALLFVALASGRAAYEAFQEEFDRQHGLSAKLQEARAAIDAGSPRRCLTLTRAALEVARSQEQRQKLWKTFAWAGVGERDPFLAHTGLQQLPKACIDEHLLAAYLCCCNRALEAQALLQEARRLGQRSAEGSKLLIEILFAQGDRAAALSVLEADGALLTDRDRQAALRVLSATC